MELAIVVGFFGIGTLLFHKLSSSTALFSHTSRLLKSASDFDLEQYNNELLRNAIFEDPERLPTIIGGGIGPSGNGAEHNCRVPLFFPPEMFDVNCKETCHHPDATKMVVRYYDEVYYEGKRLEEGVYCTLSVQRPCSKRFGFLVHNFNEWTCMAKYPLVVGGPAANLYLAGQHPRCTPTENAKNGLVLSDGSTMFVPDPVDTAPLDFDSMQMRCAGTTIDGASLMHVPDSFTCVIDPCNTVPFGASYFDGQYCQCSYGTQHSDPNDPTTPCVFAHGTYEQKRLRLPVPCYDSGTLIKDRTDTMMPCVNDNNPVDQQLLTLSCDLEVQKTKEKMFRTVIDLPDQTRLSQTYSIRPVSVKFNSAVGEAVDLWNPFP